MRARIPLMLLMLSSAAMYGCTNIQSKFVDPSIATVHKGLIYHLPRQRVKLIVTVKNKVGTPDVQLSDVYPDLSLSFLLNISNSQFGNNAVNIGVNSNGLLSSAKSISTSSVDEILKNVAGTIATVGGPFRKKGTSQKPDKECSKDGTYFTLVEVTQATTTFCHFTFAIWDAMSPQPSAFTESKPEEKLARVEMVITDIAKGSYSGIFYRQLVPAIVEAAPEDDPDAKTDVLVLVPNINQIDVLPVPKSLFADNTTSITFSNGMPTEYDPQVNSEILGVFKIPADVVAAYFNSIGQLFNAFGSAKKDEASAAANAAYLQLQQYKISLCLKALAAKDDKGINASCPSGAQ